MFWQCFFYDEILYFGLSYSKLIKLKTTLFLNPTYVFHVTPCFEFIFQLQQTVWIHIFSMLNFYFLFDERPRFDFLLLGTQTRLFQAFNLFSSNNALFLFESNSSSSSLSSSLSLSYKKIKHKALWCDYIMRWNMVVRKVN